MVLNAMSMRIDLVPLKHSSIIYQFLPCSTHTHTYYVLYLYLNYNILWTLNVDFAFSWYLKSITNHYMQKRRGNE